MKENASDHVPYWVVLSKIELLCQSLLENRMVTGRRFKNLTVCRIKDFIDLLKRFDVSDEECRNASKRLNKIRMLFARDLGFEDVISLINDAILRFEHESYVIVLENDHNKVYCSGKKIELREVFEKKIEIEERKGEYEAYTHSWASWYKVRVGDVIVVEKNEIDENLFAKKWEKATTVFTIRISGLFKLPKKIPDIEVDNGKIHEWESELRASCEYQVLESITIPSNYYR